MAKNPWTEDELGFIQSHDDWTAQRIADELGRSASSVQGKRCQVRSGWTPVRSRWTTYEDDFLIANATMTAKDAAAYLGRSKLSVDQRRNQLTKNGRASTGFGHNASPRNVGSRPLLAKTCIKCGLLLQAKWFMNNGRGEASSSCTRCRKESEEKRVGKDRIRERKTQWLDRCQALTVPGATRHGEPWIEVDFPVLMNPDMTRMQKALLLHRTYLSIAGKCQSLGYMSKASLGDPERDQWMIDNPNLDRLDEITASLPAPLGAPMEPETPKRTAPSWDWDDVDLRAS